MAWKNLLLRKYLVDFWRVHAFSVEMEKKIQALRLETEFISHIAIHFILLMAFIDTYLVHWGSLNATAMAGLFYLPFLCLRSFLIARKKHTFETLSIYSLLDTFFIAILIWTTTLHMDLNFADYLKLPSFYYLFPLLVCYSLSLNIPLILIHAFATLFANVILAVHSFKRFDLILEEIFFFELHRLIVFSLMTLGLLLLIHVCKKLMSQSEGNQNIYRFFSPQVAEFIKSGNLEIQPGRGSKKMATVLFLDLRDFTKFTQTTNPDKVFALLNEYHRRMIPIILRNNGVIDKFLGDGILAHFGAIVENETHAKDCLTAIEEILFEIDSWNYELRTAGEKELDLNMAAASGLVIFGATGDQDRQEMTVIGSAVNTAAKLEKYNKVLKSKALVTETTMQLTRKQGYTADPIFEFLEEQTVSGLPEKINLFYLPQKRSSIKVAA